MNPITFTVKAGTYAHWKDKPDWHTVKSGLDIDDLPSVIDCIKDALDKKKQTKQRMVVQIAEDYGE